MDGKSLDVTANIIAQLKATLPDVFSEDKIDFQRLKQALGEDNFVKGEHYALNWAGKTEARKEIQQPTTATLIPNRAESRHFDKANHIFIEGENLEVLRTLQKSYFGKVKMIYIDPPYNTGNDSFVYPDDYTERQNEYKKRTGLTNSAGFLNKQDLWKKNVKENGQFHSVWMSMMYPRLYLSRNLLKEDGVIFISIDDNEAANLKLMCDEIFGEENFEGHIHWRRRHNQPNDKTKMIGLVAEHILSYAKNSDTYKKSGVGKIDLTGSFSNPDNDLKGEWASKPWKVGSDQTGSRYKITNPKGNVLDEEWMGDEGTFNRFLDEKRIYFPKNGEGLPRKKYYKFEREEEGQCATNWWSNEDFGHNQEGNEEMTELFQIKNIFSNPKPYRLVRSLIQISNAKNNDLILDFFAGSGTTAQAVMELNEEDGGNRRFICVQMPEKTEESSEAYKAGYKTIAEITQARIKKVIEKLQTQRQTKALKEKRTFNKENDTPQYPLGFQSYKLAISNFKQWNKHVTGEQALLQQLDVFQQAEIENSLPENMLYELLIKSGFDLATSVEKVQIDENTKLYKVDNGKLWVFFDTYTPSVKTAILAAKPEKLIVLDSCFDGDDAAITNLQLALRENGIDLTII